MSRALPTSLATAMDASKECGSVFGLDMMALAWTYSPPTWPITSAYSFSAPTATILPPFEAAVAPPEDAAATVATTAASTASSRMATGRRPAPRRGPALPASVLPALPRIPTLPADSRHSGTSPPDPALTIIVSIISKQLERGKRRGSSRCRPWPWEGRPATLQDVTLDHPRG